MIAHVLAEHGATLALPRSASPMPPQGCRTPAPRQPRTAAGVAASVIVVDEDLAMPGADLRVVARAADALARIDAMARCVGARDPLAFPARTAETIQRQVAIHVAATMEILQATLPAMRARGRGRVLRVTELHATRPHTDRMATLVARAAQVQRWHALAVAAMRCSAAGAAIAGATLHVTLAAHR